MFRNAWLIASLAVAVIASLLLYGSLPELLTLLLPARTPQGVIDIATQSALPAIAVFGAGLITLYNLIGPGGLALLDMLTTKRARANLAPLLAARRAGQAISRRDFLIAMEDAGDLTSIAEDYATGLISGKDSAFNSENAHARLSSDSFFGRQALVERRLMMWLSKALCWLLMGVGGLLFAASLIIGADQANFESRLGDATAGGALMQALETGLIAWAIAGSGALIAAVWLHMLAHLRGHQAGDLARDIDILFHTGSGGQPHAQAADGALLAGPIVQALEPSMQALREASIRLSGDQADAVKALLSDVTRDFTRQQTDHFGGQIGTMRQMLESAAAAVKALEEAAKGSNAAALKHIADHGRNLARALDHAVKEMRDIRPLLMQSAEQGKAIRQHLESDGSTARQLQKSAKDMAAAAQASRETVERFITLAEKLREAAQALTGPGGELQTPADPEAARRLSEALRELRRVAGTSPR